MHQVTTVAQARSAVEAGVDILIAQGTEAGGYGGYVAEMALVPQVVDVAGDVPVIAAGGIFDGRGLAAALALGAAGVNAGTRFLATHEAPVADGWKQAILAASSENAVKADVWNDIMPLPGMGGYGTVPRALRTAFLDEWAARRGEAKAQADTLLAEIMAALPQGRFHEYVPFAGQTAGAIDEILPAAEVVRRMVDEAETALRRAASFIN